MFTPLTYPFVRIPFPLRSNTFVVAPLVLLQITFLEFFEVLLGSAEVKCQQVSEGPEEGQGLSGHDTEAWSTLHTTNSPFQSVRSFLNLS